MPGYRRKEQLTVERNSLGGMRTKAVSDAIMIRKRSEMMEHIGTKIQALRRNKAVTQAQLAEALAVTAQSVSKWENRLSMPDVSLLPEIARYFGITMDELFGYRLDALNYKDRFIRFMADNGALQFGRFPLRCGRVSPYFIRIGSYASASRITRLGEFYAACIRENNVETNLLAGTTPREIPIMMAVGMALLNRFGVDIHYSAGPGTGKPPAAGDQVTLIKDTLTTGWTLRENLRGLSDGPGQALRHVIVAVDRMERPDGMAISARRALEAAYPVKVHAIVTLEDIIRAMENGVVGGEEHLEAIKRYKQQYGGA